MSIGLGISVYRKQKKNVKIVNIICILSVAIKKNPLKPHVSIMLQKSIQCTFPKCFGIYSSNCFKPYE